MSNTTLTSAYPSLAWIAIHADPEKDLIGPAHKPRINAGIGWNGMAKDWERRTLLNAARLTAFLEYSYYGRNCTRVYAYDFAQNLTNEQLAKIPKLREAANRHRENLLPKATPTHDTRLNRCRHEAERAICNLTNELPPYVEVEEFILLEELTPFRGDVSAKGNVIFRHLASEAVMAYNPDGRHWNVFWCPPGQTGRKIITANRPLEAAKLWFSRRSQLHAGK